MGRVLGLDFSGGTARGPTGGGGVDILDEVNKSESTFAELTYDAKAVIVDPDIASAVDGVVESIEAREGTPHPQGRGILIV